MRVPSPLPLGITLSLGITLVSLPLMGCASDDNPPPDPVLSGGTAGAAGNSGASGSSSGGSSSGGSSSGGSSSGGVGGSSGRGGAGGGSGAGGSGATTSDNLYGEVHSGVYHLGPVDYEETEWHNACAPAEKYRPPLRTLMGNLLGGVSGQFGADGSLCDACMLVKTATGRSAVLRIVTYGVEAEPGDIDVSPEAFELLHSGEFPREMTWQLTKCPESGTIRYEFQTEASIWWTSLWVRNARVPLTKVEVKSANHPQFVELDRGGDGTLTDGGGFGEGAFTFRLTGIDGQVLEDGIPWFDTGELVISTKQFK